MHRQREFVCPDYGLHEALIPYEVNGSLEQSRS